MIILCERDQLAHDAHFFSSSFTDMKAHNRPAPLQYDLLPHRWKDLTHMRNAQHLRLALIRKKKRKALSKRTEWKSGAEPKLLNPSVLMVVKIRQKSELFLFFWDRYLQYLQSN